MLGGVWRLRASRLVKNPGAAVYGAIVTTASVAAGSHREPRAWVVLVEVLSTLAVFWLAHVHSAVISARFADPETPLRRLVIEALDHELPMLEAALVPVVLLAIAAAGEIAEGVAVDAALWAGVAELFAMGVLRGRRAGHALRSVVVGLAYAASGGALVLLKTALH